MLALRRLFSGYGAEVFITVVGLVAALAQALLTENRDLLVVLIVITLLVNALSVAVRVEVKNRLLDDINRIVETIEHPVWHTAARAKVRELHAELREWAEGRRLLVGDAGLVYQTEVVHRTARSLDAIHIALAARSLKRWDKETGEFNAFVEAHERLPSNVRGRRILVLDDQNADLVKVSSDGTRKLSDLAVRVCARQMRPRSEEGLGFEVRILWQTTVSASHDRLPPDLLISDRTEAIVLKNVSQTGTSEYYETEAYTTDVRVGVYLQIFEELWHQALPARTLIPGIAETSTWTLKLRIRHPIRWLLRRPPS